MNILEISPMLLKPVQTQEDLPLDENSMMEGKWDGNRMLAGHDTRTGRWSLVSKSGIYNNDKYPEVVEALPEAVHGLHVILDCELVVLDRTGRQNRNELSARASQAILMVFDLLALDEKRLFHVPLKDRRSFLTDEVLDLQAAPAHVQFSEDFPATKSTIEDFHRQQFEGVVVKRKNSLYRPRKRSSDWLKFVFPEYVSPKKLSKE